MIASLLIGAVPKQRKEAKMNELIQKLEPKDADNQKIVAAILSNAVCALIQGGTNANDAFKAVALTYEHFLAPQECESGPDVTLAVWEMLKNT